MNLKSAPWSVFSKDKNEEILKILEILGQARLVGGCVRDFILYNKLANDIDIATPFKPEEVMAMLKPYFKVLPTGIKHGTVTVVGQQNYEITTLRKDVETDGRFAVVEFDASWQEDSNRRDFTMNSLYSDSQGNLYDYHNGAEDLAKKHVVFIGNARKRIEEDYLRILRFFRFSSRFGGFSHDNLEAVYDLKSGLLQISKERITKEVLKILEGAFFIKIWEFIKPIFVVLNLKPEVDFKNWEKLSSLAKLAKFYQDDSLLRLSNKEKKYIENIQSKSFYSKRSVITAYNDFGKDFVEDKFLFDDVFFNDYEKTFPIKGGDLLNLGIQGSQISTTLKRIMKIWAREDGKLQKSDLLDLALKIKEA